MSEYTTLFERAGERYASPALPAEDLFRRRDRKRRNQRIATTVLALVLAVGSIGGLLRAFGQSDGSQPATPTHTPTTPSLEDLLVQPPPAGYETRMTLDEVQAYVMGLIAHDEETLGKALVSPRIVSIRFLMPREHLRVDNGVLSEKEASWAVEYEGTVVSCGSYCLSHLGATIVFHDGNPDMNASSAANLAPVCWGPNGPGQDAERPKSLEDLPDCSQLPGIEGSLTASPTSPSG